MPHHRTLATSVLLLIVGASLALAGMESRDGAPASFAGVPAIGAKGAESNCGVCHFGSEWNNLDTPGGALEILDLPAAYETGRTYPLTVRLRSDSTAAFVNRSWGFELTAVRASDGEGCGTFVVAADDTLRIVAGGVGEFSSRSYVTHGDFGRRDGLGGPVTWTFDWRAPDAPSGTVLFHAAAVAANGDHELTGDFVHTAAGSAADAATTARATRWGALKKLYR